MDIQMRMMELAQAGYECSQIMMILALEMEGLENPELIRAMGGLTRGIGGCQKACGVLTGGCCILGLYTCKGEPEEPESEYSKEILAEYTRWFEEELTASWGGTDCRDILGEDLSRSMVTCQELVEQAFLKVVELLQERGYID